MITIPWPLEVRVSLLLPRFAGYFRFHPAKRLQGLDVQSASAKRIRFGAALRRFNKTHRGRLLEKRAASAMAVADPSCKFPPTGPAKEVRKIGSVRLSLIRYGFSLTKGQCRQQAKNIVKSWPDGSVKRH